MTDTELDAIQIILIILVPAVISGVVAVIVANLAKKSAKTLAGETRGIDASAAEKISIAYDLVIKNLQLEITQIEKRQELLEEKVDKQQKRIVHLESGVSKLIKQIKLMGAEPVFMLENGFETTEEK